MRLIPDAVCWHDGMPLLPQHFQVQALRAEGMAAHYAAVCQPHFWGLLSLQLDESALVSGLVRITELDALLPDGLVVRLVSGRDAPLELDVTEAVKAAANKTVTVQLAVPPLYRGGRLDPGAGRFRSASSEAIPDLASGEGAAPMPVWRPAARLVADSANLDFIRLPLLRLRQQGGGLARAPYLPPCPLVTPESPLGRRLGMLCTALREKGVFLSGRLQASSRAGDHQSVAEITRLLTALWQRLPELEAALNTGTHHPSQLYVLLAGVAGTLAALNPGAGVPAFRPFDYQEMQACFDPVVDWIEAALERVREGYKVLAFSQARSGFSIDLSQLPPPAKELVIGLRMPQGSGDGVAQDWLSQAIIASEPHLPALARQRMRGLPRRALGRDERAAFSVGDDTELFRLGVDADWFDAKEQLHIARPAGATEPPWEIMLFVPDEKTEARARQEEANG
ncbi:type VI secretion system baseplate subunit TssK [Gallaecimonas kandeliae]|uniref:type VI secretion system baseplate subunit TssK n=1 Tax=Gallaecimonas kandeliae TaxID=3029055 RepID=UPI002648D81C|nr:type VI secretion system baseplate subunit TssK [Gallaecimonas kandeliae]WKE64477.1 type VI secretion system baseplate subunit TssK [Gallaecimonas kandeliae]